MFINITTWILVKYVCYNDVDFIIKRRFFVRTAVGFKIYSINFSLSFSFSLYLGFQVLPLSQTLSLTFQRQSFRCLSQREMELTRIKSMSTRRSLSTSLLTSVYKPDRTLSASEYSLLSIKRDASLASTRCRRKVCFSGKSEDQMRLILCLIFLAKKIRQICDSLFLYP